MKNRDLEDLLSTDVLERICNSKNIKPTLILKFAHKKKEVRDILELILNNLFTEPFDRKFQHCVDSVFFDNIYENISENNLYDNDCCFPENYIMPTAP